MDVGPLFIPHTQAAKLIEPGKGALGKPPLLAIGTPAARSWSVAMGGDVQARHVSVFRCDAREPVSHAPEF